MGPSTLHGLKIASRLIKLIRFPTPIMLFLLQCVGFGSPNPVAQAAIIHPQRVPKELGKWCHSPHLVVVS